MLAEQLHPEVKTPARVDRRKEIESDQIRSDQPQSHQANECSICRLFEVLRRSQKSRTKTERMGQKMACAVSLNPVRILTVHNASTLRPERIDCARPHTGRSCGPRCKTKDTSGPAAGSGLTTFTIACLVVLLGDGDEDLWYTAATPVKEGLRCWPANGRRPGDGLKSHGGCACRCPSSPGDGPCLV